MTISNIIGLLQSALVLVFVAGGGYVASAWLKKQAGLQKSEHAKFALTVASQVVLGAQALLAPGSVQEEDALSKLMKRLKANKLDGYFTEEQALSYIKQAYATNKANGTLATVKPVVSDDALKEAESVITATDQTGKATIDETSTTDTSK